MPASQSLAAHYEEIYSRHSDFGIRWRSLGARDKAKNVRALCAEYPHQTILEIGCGDGAVIRELAGFGEHLQGLEISKQAVNQCTQAGLDVRLFDGSRIPFQDRSFDLAILSHVVEHLESPREILTEAVRVARYVFVEVPLEDNRGLGMDFVPNDIGHINFYSVKTIRQLVQTCRMRITAQKVSHSSLAGYRYRLGSRGYVAWAIKSATLPFPRIATRLWTYHYSLLATGTFCNQFHRDDLNTSDRAQSC